MDINDLTGRIIGSAIEVHKALGPSAPLLIKELHEFLTIEGVETISEPLEMRALYA